MRRLQSGGEAGPGRQTSTSIKVRVTLGQFPLLQRSSMPVKTLLLDQGKLVCGIGNWVADEVLHQACIHPAAPADSLSDRQAEALRAAVLFVVRTAVAADADSERFPKGWLFHIRWGARPKSGAITLPSGSEVEFMEVGGRTTLFVAASQQEGERPSQAGIAIAPKPSRRNSRAGSAASLPVAKRPAANPVDAPSASANAAAFAVPLKRPAASGDAGTPVEL